MPSSGVMWMSGDNMYKHVTKKKRKGGSIRASDTIRCASKTKEPCGGRGLPWR
ncbi:hypothetical protein [Streptomyces sp. NPDC002054]|uniref:hypothetical protein n=1 Tax=Streptomyces sp. NPDC002054 TaxID=3154663 RepID=UPI0033236FCD